MSENEKAEQIGKLAEEYSHKRGELNHIVEKLNRFLACCQILADQQVSQSLRIENGKVVYTPLGGYSPLQQQPTSLESLLNHSELLKVMEEKQRLNSMVTSLAERLRALAPHLL